MKTSLRQPDILKQIFDAHKGGLGESFEGIILCGSAGSKGGLSEAQDVDYVVVLKSISAELLKTMAHARQKLSEDFGIEFSNTVALAGQVEKIKDSYKHLDGKLVQAVIESGPGNTRLMHVRPPKLSKEEVKDFSEHNFNQLKNFLAKLLVRFDGEAGANEKSRILKVSRVLVKMARQSGLTADKTRSLEDRMKRYLTDPSGLKDTELYNVACAAMELI